MRILGLLLCATLACPAFAAPPAAAREFTELTPGRYRITLTGLLCAVCARAIAAEWKKLPEVESASADFETSSAAIVVRLDRTLKVAALRKALRRAEKLANLDARYEVLAISYRIGK